MTATQYRTNSYVKGVNGFGMPFSEDCYQLVLQNGSAQTLTVPNSAPVGIAGALYNEYLAVFHYAVGAEVWVAKNKAATIPVAGPFVATTSTLNPNARLVVGGDVLHFDLGTATDAVVSVEFLAIQG